MGVLLSNPNPAIQNMFRDLNQDPFAEQTLSHVADGAFGPRALARYAHHYDSANARAARNQLPQPQATGSQNQSSIPNSDWQLRTVRMMMARSQARGRENNPSLSSPSTSTSPPQLGYNQGPRSSSDISEAHISQHSSTSESERSAEELSGASDNES